MWKDVMPRVRHPLPSVKVIGPRKFATIDAWLFEHADGSTKR